eukprot:m.297550 g.297550  ORF g.297550 m.297550 type:complete len:538 (+) comp13640_c0_seq1:30-1643(+)
MSAAQPRQKACKRWTERFREKPAVGPPSFCTLVVILSAVAVAPHTGMRLACSLLCSAVLGENLLVLDVAVERDVAVLEHEAGRVDLSLLVDEAGILDRVVDVLEVHHEDAVEHEVVEEAKSIASVVGVGRANKRELDTEGSVGKRLAAGRQRGKLGAWLHLAVAIVNVLDFALRARDTDNAGAVPLAIDRKLGGTNIAAVGRVGAAKGWVGGQLLAQLASHGLERWGGILTLHKDGDGILNLGDNDRDVRKFALTRRVLDGLLLGLLDKVAPDADAGLLGLGLGDSKARVVAVAVCGKVQRCKTLADEHLGKVLVLDVDVSNKVAIAVRSLNLDFNVVLKACAARQGQGLVSKGLARLAFAASAGASEACENQVDDTRLLGHKDTETSAIGNVFDNTRDAASTLQRGKKLVCLSLVGDLGHAVRRRLTRVHALAVLLGASLGGQKVVKLGRALLVRLAVALNGSKALADKGLADVDVVDKNGGADLLWVAVVGLSDVVNIDGDLVANELLAEKLARLKGKGDAAESLEAGALVWTAL